MRGFLRGLKRAALRADDHASRLFPRRPSVLVCIYNAISLAALKPVILALVEAGANVRLSRDDSYRGTVSAEYQEQPFRALWIPAEKAAWKKWDVVLTSISRTIQVRRNRTRVYLHHGYAFGVATDIHMEGGKPRYEATLLLSAKEKHAFPAAAACGNSLLHVVGSPQLDAVVAGRFGTARELAERHGLDPSKKTVLVVSHWSERSLLRSLGTPLLERLLRFPVNVIVALHESARFGRSWLGEEGPSEEVRKTMRFLSEHPGRAVLAQDLDFKRLFAADVLLSDYSSTLVGFGAAGKPTVYYDDPGFEFLSPSTAEAFRRGTLCFRTLEEAEARLEEALALTLPHGPALALAREFVDHLGEATPRACSAILRIAAAGPYGSRRWRRLREELDGRLVETRAGECGR